jgi:hypothetical protein
MTIPIETSASALTFHIKVVQGDFSMTQLMTKKLAKSAIAATAIAVASVGILATQSRAANLGGYTFEPPPNPGSPDASGVAPGLTFSTFEYVGSGSDNFPVGYDPSNPPQNNGGKSYSANDFSPDDSIDTSDADADGYFTFGISIDPSKLTSFDLTGLSFVTQPNGNASPINIQVRSSLDNFASALFNSSLGSKNVWTPQSAPLTLDDLTSITFRIYPYGQNNNNGAKNLDIDNVYIAGSTTPVPTPALLPGLIGMGVAALRKRNGETEESTEA